MRKRVQQETICTEGSRKRNGVAAAIRRNWQFLLMVVPGTLLAVVFSYLPMFGIVVAFKKIDYAKGIFGSPWVGMKNFNFLFGYPDLKIILRNTLGYNIMFIILGAVIPVTLAMLLSQLRNKRVSKVYQTVMMLPNFMSWVVVSYIVFAFLSFRLGIVNTMLLTGLGKAPVDWYSETKLWPFLIIFLNVWKSFGYNTVVYLAAIAGIDGALYEAAAIDGATRRQQMRYITLPELSNIVIIMMILGIGRIMTSDFGLFYNVPMEKGALFPVTNVISTFVYRSLKVNGDIGMSSAAGFFQSVIGFVLVVLTNGIVKRIDESKSLF
mgnify:FL=1